jgi:predicted Holliday junction resolvase-like endonuclease
MKCYKPESLREDSIAKVKAWEKEEAIEKEIKKAKQDSI